MSIYIKNATGANCCGECEYNFCSQCARLIFNSLPNIQSLSKLNYEIEDDQKKLPNCPIKEIPTPHRRLIEVPTELSYKGLQYYSPYDYKGIAKYFLDQIKELPAIIESEE